MLCEMCHKREATVHIKEISGGQTKVWHLCEECAAKQAVGETGVNPLNLAAFLYQLASKSEKEAAADAPSMLDEDTPPPASAPDLRCPVCGLTASEFHKMGRLGCPACYDAFQEIISDVLVDLHRDVQHKGRSPAGPAPMDAGEERRRRLCLLNEELDQAVASEAYERAAVLRDEIRKLTEDAGDNEGCTPDDR